MGVKQGWENFYAFNRGGNLKSQRDYFKELFQKEQGETKEGKNNQTNHDSNDNDGTKQNRNPGEAWGPNRRNKIIAIERSRGEVGGEASRELVGRWVAINHAGHTVKITWTIPTPAITNSLRLTGFHSLGKDIAIRITVGILAELRLGFTQGNRGLTIILMLQINWTGTKSERGVAIFFDEIHDGVRGTEISQVFQGGANILVNFSLRQIGAISSLTLVGFFDLGF